MTQVTCEDEGMRKLAFVFALSSISALALAAAPADKKESTKEGGKAKAGQACKVSSDCDQSARSQSCVSNKCEAQKIMPPT